MNNLVNLTTGQKKHFSGYRVNPVTNRSLRVLSSNPHSFPAHRRPSGHILPHRYEGDKHPLRWHDMGIA